MALDVPLSHKESTSAILEEAAPSSQQITESKASRIHLDYVDGLRGIAALYVACEHFLPRVWEGANPPVGILRLLAKVLVQGHFAVTMFIVISGFCLMIPVIRAGNVLRGGSVVFFCRRFLRIAPPLYIAFLFSIVLLQAGSGSVGIPPYYSDTHVTTTQWVGHLLLLHTFIPGAALPNNGVLWSVSVECVIYLTFPLFVLLWRRLGLGKSTSIYLLAGYLLVVLANNRGANLGCPQYLGAFALGALAAGIAIAPTGRWIAARSNVNWYLLAMSAFILLSSFCIIVGWERCVSPLVLPWLDLLVAAATTFLLIGLSIAKRTLTKSLLCWRPLVFIGTFSYSLYMIHYPLEDIIFNYVVKPLHLSQETAFLLMVIVALPVIVLLAYLFFLAFERPFHGIAKRYGAVSK